MCPPPVAHKLCEMRFLFDSFPAVSPGLGTQYKSAELIMSDCLFLLLSSLRAGAV